MNFATWFRTWLIQHPLKTPTGHDPAWYTAQVMQRVRAMDEPHPVPASGWRWPSWVSVGLIAATATVGFLLVIGVLKQSQTRLANQLLQESETLAQLDEHSTSEPVMDNDMEGLAQELQLHDTLVLAESTPSDDQWVEQHLQLFDQLDEDPATEDTSQPSSEEDWLQELKRLDESELGSST